MNRAALITVPALVLVACSASVESTDCTLPAADGTRVIEYSPVTAAERTERLQLERDLGLTGAFDTPFYRPRAIALAPNGDIFVLDEGNDRIVVFDRDGSPLRQFGRAGQGPDEFQDPDAIAVVGGTVVVHQGRQRRIGVFSVEGAQLVDHVLEDNLGWGGMIGFEDALIVVNARGTPLPIRPGQGVPRTPWVVGVYAPDGSERTRVVEAEDMARARYLTEDTTGLFPIAAPHPKAALAPDGRVHATCGGEYEILAFEPTGRSARWRLRVGAVPQSVTEALKDQVTARRRAPVYGLERSPGLGRAGRRSGLPHRVGSGERGGGRGLLPGGHGTVATSLRSSPSSS